MEKSLAQEAVARLPRYLRYLREYLSQGRSKIASGELSKKLGITSSQVRRDMGQLEVSGHNGFGYLTHDAYHKTAEKLGLNVLQKIVIIGSKGSESLLLFPALELHGFEIVGIYDTDLRQIGKRIGSFTVKALSALREDVQTTHPEIALLFCSDAVDTAGQIEGTGIRGILNFSGADLELPEVEIENIHLDDRLMLLSYRIRHK